MTSFGQSDHELSPRPSNQNHASISLVEIIARFLPYKEVGQFQTIFNQMTCSNQRPPLVDDYIQLMIGHGVFLRENPASVLATWILKIGEIGFK